MFVDVVATFWYPSRNDQFPQKSRLNGSLEAGKNEQERQNPVRETGSLENWEFGENVMNFCKPSSEMMK